MPFSALIELIRPDNKKKLKIMSIFTKNTPLCYWCRAKINDGWVEKLIDV